MSARRISRLSALALGLGLMALAPACSSNDVDAGAARAGDAQAGASAALPEAERWQLSDEQWRARLTPEQYDVLRQKGTERAFSGALWNAKTHGVFRCAGCGLELFDGDTKFESGTGWPSFWTVHAPGHVAQTIDRSWLGIARTEVLCGRCGGHLGHVFDDGPQPTGLRYCINSVALSLDGDPGSEAPAGDDGAH